MKSRSLMVFRAFAIVALGLAVIAIATAPAFGQVDLPGRNNPNWRVFNVKPATAAFWDINKAKDYGIGLQFPIQSFETETTGSFVVYLLANYNNDITGKTFTTRAAWTPGEYKTRSSSTCSGAFVRFEFQDVASGPYDSNDYWWSTGDNSLDLNAGSTGDLSVSLADRSKWSNQAGRPATETTTNWIDWTGSIVAMSPYDGFTKAMKNVKQLGLSFGNPCRYASGVAIVGAPGTYIVNNFAITP